VLAAAGSVPTHHIARTQRGDGQQMARSFMREGLPEEEDVLRPDPSDASVPQWSSLYCVLWS